MKTLLDNQMRFHQAAFNLQAHRQELLASNIANADTPHYKARDIDFRSALDSALGNAPGGGLPGVALDTTHRGHIAGGGAPGADSFTLYRTELQSAVDGNTVNMDVERAAFAENSLRYEASVTFINGMLRSMNTALTGQ
ncbi:MULTISPECIES: flagellar basal body rod protein FlgB [Thauera]|uniref:Flagellar basal body rod protein FlgB n=1 Tax=Thauera linaloolentis (strain DSM 12138 / JCM 21573 / CCUG 41526 / CIP 105981 / IAM 15112 / NBRC 102519 / 47Lol) TaxID=1123367 RepID=N6Y5N1_THAL4|nr:MULTISPECIES: flagellar basal body rod protein FlgB [Thauera]ENO89521.1 flagellar basal-body rod protein FlgB [Thauera linaloolentis 47Lol = DSM 12138]MCM8565416.1 flagellar basal body rod protein FlgB [Thauera linaloolentis]